MQLGDGAYNVSLLEAMDQFVAASANRGLKLIMSLSNNWNYNSNMSDTKCAPPPCLLRREVACVWLSCQSWQVAHAQALRRSAETCCPACTCQAVIKLCGCAGPGTRMRLELPA